MKWKNIYKTAFVCCKHKRKGLHVPPKGLKLDIWMESVTEASSILGLICPDGILNLEPSPKAKSRSSKSPGLPSL